MTELSRSERLFGKENIEKLKSKRVIVFGIGGVGGYVCEALARTGVGHISLVDNDTVSLSNINRQIIALHSTVGKSKTEVMKERIADINPDIEVFTYNLFFTPDTSGTFNFGEYDYIVDAIDTVSGKIELAVKAKEAGVPIISSMGTGNKFDPCAFKVSDIYKTSVCPLARVMRSELKKRGIEKLKVVYSEEKPVNNPDKSDMAEQTGRKIPPASCAFVPSVAGFIIGGEVIKDLIKQKTV